MSFINKYPSENKLVTWSGSTEVPQTSNRLSLTVFSTYCFSILICMWINCLNIRSHSECTVSFLDCITMQILMLKQITHIWDTARSAYLVPLRLKNCLAFGGTAGDTQCYPQPSSRQCAKWFLLNQLCLLNVIKMSLPSYPIPQQLNYAQLCSVLKKRLAWMALFMLADIYYKTMLLGNILYF